MLLIVLFHFASHASGGVPERFSDDLVANCFVMSHVLRVSIAVGNMDDLLHIPKRAGCARVTHQIG